jgi:flagellar hook assembly protein FlgD
MNRKIFTLLLSLALSTLAQNVKAQFLSNVIVDRLFSPQAANSAASIMFNLGQHAWVSIKIEDENKNRIRLLVAKTMCPGEYYFLWDGTNQQGQFVPQGTYYCIIRAEDVEVIGNEVIYKGEIYEEVKKPISIEYLDFAIIEAADNFVFSPNGDGVKDKINIFYKAEASGYIKVNIKDTYEVENNDWKIIKSYPLVFVSEGNHTFTWDGRDENGKIKEGFYEVEIRLYRTLDSELGGGTPYLCVIDTTPPNIINLSPEPLYFSLSEGAVRIEYILTDWIQEKVKLIDAEGEEVIPTIDTTIKIYDESGRVIRTLINNEPRRLAIGENFEALYEERNSEIWDGKDDNGVIVKEGIYTYTIQSKDDGGNQTTVKGTIYVDGPPIIFDKYFVQRKDGSYVDGMLWTNTKTPSLRVTVQDVLSGLDVNSAKYLYKTENSDCVATGFLNLLRIKRLWSHLHWKLPVL